ncbi:MAG: CBS domain-containing protein [Ktedonobacterales bacterium]
MFASLPALLSTITSSRTAIAAPLVAVFAAVGLALLLTGIVVGVRMRHRWLAQRSERALRQLRVDQAMEAPGPSATITMSLREFENERMGDLKGGGVHVTQWNQLVGMVSRRDLRRFDEERWENVRVGAAMTPLERVLTFEPDQPLLEAHRLMAHREVDHAPVVVHGRVVGMLNRATVLRLIVAGKVAPVAREAGSKLRQRLPVAN